MLRDGVNPWLVVLLVLLMGMALGAIMGGFIAYLKVQPFIATLAGMWFARGMCFFISDDAVAISHPFFRILALTRLLIPGLSDPATQRGDFVTILTVLSFLVLIVARTGCTVHQVRTFPVRHRRGRAVRPPDGPARSGYQGHGLHAERLLLGTWPGSSWRPLSPPVMACMPPATN